MLVIMKAVGLVAVLIALVIVVSVLLLPKKGADKVEQEVDKRKSDSAAKEEQAKSVID